MTVNVGSTVWLSTGAVLVALLATSVAIYLWIGSHEARRPWFWSLMFVALVFSGPAVRTLVQWRTASPLERIVPGLVPTWTPAIVALAVSWVLWRRLKRVPPRAPIVPAART